MGRRGHDLAAVTRRISFIPMIVVAVTEQHGMDMAIPKPWQHVHAFGRNHFCIGRHLEFANGPDGGDAFVFDNYHAVGQWMAAEAVNEATAH